MANKTKAEIQAENDELQKTNKELQEEMSDIKKMLEQLMNSNGNTESRKVETTEVLEDEAEIIPPNKYIRVTSLCNGKLILTSQKNGKGIIFNSFGQTRNIMFQNLEEIVAFNRKMAENGRYYIQDEKVVKLLMIDDVYESILDDKAIRSIVDNKASNLIEVFNLAPEKQKEHIVSMIVNKAVKGDEVDYNQIYKISQAYGADLMVKISEAKENRKSK